MWARTSIVTMTVGAAVSPVCVQVVCSQTASSDSSTRLVGSPEATSTPEPSGSGYGSGPKLTTQRKPGSRVNDSTSGGVPSSQLREPSPRAGWRRRSARAARYRLSMLVRSFCWASTVSSDQCAGCGSQGGCSGDPKPNGGSVPDQGIGTRQPSRPRWV